MKNLISILGSTGSIGRTTLKIIDKKKSHLTPYLFSGNKNYKLICSQIKKYHPKIFVINNYQIFKKFKIKFKKKKIEILNNFSDIKRLKKSNTTISAIPGIAGLHPTLLMIKLCKTILIANKEAIICGWSLIRNIASKIYTANDVLYLGRGVNHGLALEGALKLKEISYIHAEGYAAGELKHGPIALIDEKVPVIGIVPFNYLYEKTLSNLQEVKARGGKVICITNEKGSKSINEITEEIFIVGDCEEICQPIVCALPVQLLAYHIANFKGTDIDQPRNLAKSVTVE